ncbi:hypothetical protein IC582_017504 [Cucumis melo]
MAILKDRNLYFYKYKLSDEKTIDIRKYNKITNTELVVVSSITNTELVVVSSITNTELVVVSSIFDI